MKLTPYASNDEILKEIGQRAKAARISASLTQEEFSDLTGLSQRTISNLETGKDVSLLTVIEILRGLGQVQNLELLFPEQGIRPSQILALSKPRERVRNKNKKDSNTDSDWKWGDEQ